MRRRVSKSASVVGGWRVAALAVFVLALTLYFRFWDETLWRISTASMDVHADFDTFWRSAVAMWEGGNIYDSGARLTNLNPPLWTVLMAPFALLDPLSAYMLFAAITLLVTVGYLLWMSRELQLGGGWAALVALMLVFSSPLLATLALGQIYPVLALGLVASWIAERREMPLASGGALGLVVAIKPSLLPVLLWPAVRRKWGTLGAALASGAAATLVGVAVLGVGAILDYAQVLREESLSAYWDNASLPAAAARLFTENEFARPLAEFPAAVPAAYAVGLAVLLLSAWSVRRNPEGGLWALVAASLLASPVAWHNYLVLLGPGVLLLLGRGRVALGLLLLALQFIPAHWPLLWAGRDTVLATLMITLYLYILLAHWAALLTLRKPQTG